MLPGIKAYVQEELHLSVIEAEISALPVVGA